MAWTCLVIIHPATLEAISCTTCKRIRMTKLFKNHTQTSDKPLMSNKLITTRLSNKMVIKLSRTLTGVYSLETLYSSEDVDVSLREMPKVWSMQWRLWKHCHRILKFFVVMNIQRRIWSFVRLYCQRIQKSSKKQSKLATYSTIWTSILCPLCSEKSSSTMFSCATMTNKSNQF